MSSKSAKSNSGVKRVTVSLPVHVLEDIDAIATLMGLGRSAFLSSLLAQTLPLSRATAETLMAKSIRQLELDRASGLDSEICLKRYRDSSRASIDSLIDSLLAGGQNDLFTSK